MPLKSSNLEQSRWFAEEVQPHGASLKAYLRGSFPTVRDVEDVVQESYLRVWRAKMAGSVESARGFLFCAARNLAIDFLRQRRRSPLEALGDLAALDVIDDRPDAFEVTAAHENAIGLQDFRLQWLRVGTVAVIDCKPLHIFDTQRFEDLLITVPDTLRVTAGGGDDTDSGLTAPTVIDELAQNDAVLQSVLCTANDHQARYLAASGQGRQTHCGNCQAGARPHSCSHAF